MYKVTVVTPSFNSAKYIEFCLKSVKEQRSSNLSVCHIIMDGGSTDNIEEVVKPFLCEDTKFISRKDNGPHDAINNGFLLADSEYVCWLNADDVYAPGALQRAVSALDTNKKASFCFGKCPIIDEEGNEIRKFITRFKEFFFPFSCKVMIQTLNYISQPSSVFRLSAVRKVGELRTDLRAAWDYDYLLRLWEEGPGICINDTQAYFRWTPTSISGQNFSRQFKEEFDAAKKQAGWAAPWVWAHWLICRLIVLIYVLMAKRHRG